MRLRDSLTPLLARLVRHEAWDKKIGETKADCGNCNQARGILAIYKESLKCCTFFPVIPNFLIGAILESELPGRTKIEAALRSETEIPEGNFLPLGLMPSITYQRRFQAGQPQGYGNDESLLCPHFVKSTGGCAVWVMRPSPCRSFFCESSYGIAGIEFWAKFEKLVSSMESILAQEVLLELGFDENEIQLSRRFLPRYNAPDPHGYTGERLQIELKKSWLEFSIDRIAFYKNCYRIVSDLKPEALQSLLDPETKKMEDELFSVYWPRAQGYVRS